MSAGVIFPLEHFPHLFCHATSWTTGSDLKQVSNKNLGRDCEHFFSSVFFLRVDMLLHDSKFSCSSNVWSYCWDSCWLWGVYVSSKRRLCLLTTRNRGNYSQISSVWLLQSLLNSWKLLLSEILVVFFLDISIYAAYFLCICLFALAWSKKTLVTQHQQMTELWQK